MLRSVRGRRGLRSVCRIADDPPGMDKRPWISGERNVFWKVSRNGMSCGGARGHGGSEGVGQKDDEGRARVREGEGVRGESERERE